MAVTPLTYAVLCFAIQSVLGSWEVRDGEQENHILPRSFPVQSYSVPQSIYVPAGSYSASVPYSSVPYSSVPYSSNVVYSSMPYASSDSSYGSMSSYSVINNSTPRPTPTPNPNQNPHQSPNANPNQNPAPGGNQGNNANGNNNGNNPAQPVSTGGAVAFSRPSGGSVLALGSLTGVLVIVL